MQPFPDLKAIIIFEFALNAVINQYQSFFPLSCYLWVIVEHKNEYICSQESKNASWDFFQGFKELHS